MCLSRESSKDQAVYVATVGNDTHVWHTSGTCMTHHMPVSPKYREGGLPRLLCAPSKVLVVEYHNSHHLFNFPRGPPGVVPSRTGSGLASCLALALGALAHKTVRQKRCLHIGACSLAAPETKIAAYKQP